MGSKLFVSNLDFELSPEKIREIFVEAGTCVNLTLVTDRETGRSRGFAFVEMATQEEANKAIAALHGKIVNGRPISVAEDRGRKPQIAGVGGDARGPSDSGEEGNSEPRQHQPLQAMQRIFLFRKKRRLDPFVEDPRLLVDYKDARTLARFMSERGRILPRRLTGLSAYNQRQVSKAIKRSQNLGLLPYTTALP